MAQEEERASSVEGSFQQEHEELERLRSEMAAQAAALEHESQSGQQQAEELQEKTAHIERLGEEVPLLERCAEPTGWRVGLGDTANLGDFTCLGYLA